MAKVYVMDEATVETVLAFASEAEAQKAYLARREGDIEVAEGRLEKVLAKIKAAEERHNAVTRSTGEVENRKAEVERALATLAATMARLEGDVGVAAAFVAKVLGADAAKIIALVRARDSDGYAAYMSTFKTARAA